MSDRPDPTFGPGDIVREKSYARRYRVVAVGSGPPPWVACVKIAFPGEWLDPSTHHGFSGHPRNFILDEPEGGSNSGD
jgi:hypothetical protein